MSYRKLSLIAIEIWVTKTLITMYILICQASMSGLFHELNMLIGYGL